MVALQHAALLALALLPLAVQASGYRPPAHSQLTYSYTCPSGTSGHIAYSKDFTDAPRTRLTIWANGRYLHEDAGLAQALAVRHIEQVQASCEGDTTVLFIETFEPSRGEGRMLRMLTVYVDRAGTARLAGD